MSSNPLQPEIYEVSLKSNKAPEKYVEGPPPKVEIPLSSSTPSSNTPEQRKNFREEDRQDSTQETHRKIGSPKTDLYQDRFKTSEVVSLAEYQRSSFKVVQPQEIVSLPVLLPGDAMSGKTDIMHLGPQEVKSPPLSDLLHDHVTHREAVVRELIYPTSNPLFDMSVERILTYFHDTEVEVQTTGAVFLLGRDTLTLYCRIDTSTDRVAAPREVARLLFDESNQFILFTVEEADSRHCVVRGYLRYPSYPPEEGTVIFEFFSDSLFLIKPNIEVFVYTHINGIRHEGRDEREYWFKSYNINGDDDFRHRMWADGRGGSLHALVPLPTSLSGVI